MQLFYLYAWSREPNPGELLNQDLEHFVIETIYHDAMLWRRETK